MLPCCVFFFSSRRRHTRYIGDWSSDVCSSDLAVVVGHEKVQIPVVIEVDEREPAHPPIRGFAVAERSEERRVGKECRWRWRREGQRKRRGARERRGAAGIDGGGGAGAASRGRA